LTLVVSMVVASSALSNLHIPMPLDAGSGFGPALGKYSTFTFCLIVGPFPRHHTIRRVAENENLTTLFEKHPDGYVADPVGIRGVAIGEGDSCADVLADVKSAIRFRLETFGPEALEVDEPVLEAFVAEATL